MKMVKWTLAVFIGLIFVGICGHFLLKPDLHRVDFAGLGEHLSSALMKPITKNLDGSSVTTIDPKSAEVYSRAGDIGMVVARRKGPPPMTSQELSELDPGKRVDPWGRPFCFSDLGNRIAVISSGANGSIAGCSELQKEISAFPSVKTGLLYRSSRGALVVVVPRSSAPS